MKKQYTKKQITEAIKHWKGVLRKMNESSTYLEDGAINVHDICIIVQEKDIDTKLNHLYFGTVDSISQQICDYLSGKYEDSVTFAKTDNIKYDSKVVSEQIDTQCRSLRKFLTSYSSNMSNKRFLIKINYEDPKSGQLLHIFEAEYSIIFNTERFEDTTICLPILMHKNISALK